MSAENIWNQITERLKNYYANHRKTANIIGGGVLLILALIAFVGLYWQPKREAAAATKLAKLHHYFETDSFAVIVNGIKGKKMATAPEIADGYPFTSKGREAGLMAGLSYLHLGKWEKALKYLKKAGANDMILGPSILAAQATCYSELGEYKQAAKAYEKAADWGENDYTAQYYKKAGIQFEKAGDLKSALRCYEIVKSDYHKAEIASDIEKYIYKVKGMLGELNN